MGDLLIYVVIVTLLGYLAIWVLDTLAPNHPKIIDGLIWVIVVHVSVLAAMRTFGISVPVIPRRC